jgi:hypothetical protein
MAQTAEAMEISTRLHEIDGIAAARALCAPPGIFQAYRDGKFLTLEIMPKDKFGKLLEKR